MGQPGRVPGRAWVVTGAGVAVNLCLGILYAWSVWKAGLLAPAGKSPGDPMDGANAGWHYLSDSEANVAFSLCGFLFAVFMIPGGKLQDRYGPRAGATLAGLALGAGCVVAGLMKSYLGLILGFGVLGGVGMGLGYAAATPAAVRWFGPHRRGLIVGLVVGGYGGAAVYIAPLARHLIADAGLSGSFVALGLLFATVIVAAAQLLKMPPAGYVPPGPPQASAAAKPAAADVPAGRTNRTWQFYALVALFVGSAQAGLLVIANAAIIQKTATAEVAFLAANAWLLAAYGGVVNASGRVGTGTYSDGIGRVNAFGINGLLAAVCLFALPAVIAAGNVWLLFLAVGVVYWQYGGTLALMPAWTADFYGSKNLGLNYGLVFLGWGIAFFVPQLAAGIKDATGSLDAAFYLSGALLAAAVAGSRFVTKSA
jgi:OFA family oxalate/formate antiporter-like MFS transporter